ncbi:MAG: CDP-glycerol glycerophosphotransferase family protein [Actinomycetia bacterium]|nr:CDP-glycerol glycerophosphotransferase family protein [Actinomycetes bacterium]
MITILLAILNGIYSVIKIVVPTRRKITMASRQSGKPGIDFQLLAREFALQEDAPEVVMLCKMLDRSLPGMISYGFHMLRQMYHFAGSSVVILDSYCILASIGKHKSDLVIIQMWHSMGTMKKFGHTTLGTNEGSTERLAHAMRMHANYNYIFASSEAYSEDLAAGFGCAAAKAVIKPLPHLDLLTSKEYALETRAKIYESLGDLSDKKTILYCPTFRKDERGLSKAIAALVDTIDYDRYNLVIKLHPLSKVTPDDPRAIIPDAFSTFEMLFVADAVISDYSCIIYEAGVLDIPLYFYCFDYEKYEQMRGLTFDYLHECPGVVSPDISEILKAIDEVAYDKGYLRTFINTYIRMTPTATKDIVDLVMPLLEGPC